MALVKQKAMAEDVPCYQSSLPYRYTRPNFYPHHCNRRPLLNVHFDIEHHFRRGTSQHSEIFRRHQSPHHFSAHYAQHREIHRQAVAEPKREFTQGAIAGGLVCGEGLDGCGSLKSA